MTGHEEQDANTQTEEVKTACVTEMPAYLAADNRELVTAARTIPVPQHVHIRREQVPEDAGSLSSTVSSFDEGFHHPRSIHQEAARLQLPGRPSAATKRSRLRAWNPSYSWRLQEYEDVTRPISVADFDVVDAPEFGNEAAKPYNSSISFSPPNVADDDIVDDAEMGCDTAESYNSSYSETDWSFDDPIHIDTPFPAAQARDSTVEQHSLYACLVDASQEDRAVEIPVGSWARPHMRAFHLAWMSFFVAFFTWFAITPLLTEVQQSLHLTKRQIWTSSIYGVAGSAVTRIFNGPFCDKFGARWAMSGTLLLSAIPTALTGLVHTATGLNVLRLFIGVAGSAFVTSQYWTYSMFTKEVAGTANALVAGWGNLGGGVTQVVMGSVLFPLFKLIYGGHLTSGENQVGANERAADLAWRTVCVVPACMCAILAYIVFNYSDDSPKGNVRERYRQGLLPPVSALNALQRAFWNSNTWILFVQYGCCFGVEITIVNASALYFKEKYGLSTESAAGIASIFGWTNLFARGLGGFTSDMANAKFGMRGRLWVQAIVLFLEGVMAVMFSTTSTLGGAITAMVVLSILVQAATGSTYGIVTYVDSAATGSVAGIVGAGGNVGGVVFAFIFREYDYHPSFSLLGFVVMASATITAFLSIKGHAALFHGRDAVEIIQRRNNNNKILDTPPNASLQQGDVESPIRSSVAAFETILADGTTS